MVDYEKLWKEINVVAQEEYPEPQRDYEKNFSELREEWNTSYPGTKLLIDKMIEQGKLGSRKAKARNGVIIDVYFPIA